MGKNIQIINDGFSPGIGVIVAPGQSGRGCYLVVKPN
jgi:hypothetical protein